MITLLGIDCATQPNKVGLALGHARGDGVCVTACRTCSRAEPPAAVVRDWLAGSECVVIGMDAPLGWAEPLGRALHGHEAGRPMGFSSNDLFRRATDRSIRERYRKWPLEAGANFISRTAVAALDLLHDIGMDRGCAAPLAWDPGALASLSAIEVYPAVTRLAHGAPDKGGSLEGLGQRIEFGPGIAAGALPADAVDAAVCVLAAADFVAGRAVPPADGELARREGWIWAPAGPDCLAGAPGS